VLGHAAVEGGVVEDLGDEGELGRKAQLFHEAAGGCGLGGFVGTGVAAGGVGPETARVVLGGGPALQQPASGVVVDQDGEGAVQGALAVGLVLFLDPDHLVVLVDQEELLELGGWRVPHAAYRPVSVQLR
jgi:hypothetical protein